jgi:hypothetical protein
MKLSEQIDQLAAALSAAQGEIEDAVKSNTNPHFKSKYADLAENLSKIRPVASKHGLAFSQCPAMRDGKAVVETILMHKSGQYIIYEPSEAVLGKNDAQGVGSATTYLRRYSIAAVFGIAQDDEDGNEASKPTPPTQPAKQKQDPADYIQANAKFAKDPKSYQDSLAAAPDKAKEIATELLKELRETTK